MAATAYAGNTYYSQDQTAKTFYRAIMKMIHPDMNPGRKNTAYEMNLLYKANDSYEVRDCATLEKIYFLLTNPQPKTQSKPKARTTSVTAQATYRNMVEFFRSQDLEVIDKRDKGGCLWVVGEPSKIDHIVKQACRMFHAGGNYAMNGGRASGYRTAWFTRCGR